MRAIYDASGWSEENEVPEGANGEVLYLLLFQHQHQPVGPADSATDAAEEEQNTDEEEKDAQRMVSLADSIIGFVAAEFSVESGKASLYIVELQLAPKAQRKGLGAKLTAAAVSEASSLTFVDCPCMSDAQ
jgi:GNAT superfamily N-acetyltransferase